MIGVLLVGCFNEPIRQAEKDETIKTKIIISPDEADK